MRNKSNFVGPIAGSAFFLAASFVAELAPADLASSIGFLFGGAFTCFMVWYYTKD